MKKLQPIALLLLLTTLVGCEEPSEVYYSTAYPIVRVEAILSSGTSTPQSPKPPLEPADSAALGNDVLSSAPVKAGGNYRLDFSRFDGGRIEVRANADAEPLPGVFIKRPGQTDLRFIYGELGAIDYTCIVGSYSDEGKNKVVLTIDLTQYYQELHPTWNIASVQRREYTSTGTK